MTHDGFHRFERRSSASVRLFCFPYAGGNAFNFSELAAALPSEIETVAIDYPGRGKRFPETPKTDMRALVTDLARKIRPYLDGPFAFYGHSNGALVAYEMAHLLPQLYFRSPEHLILGAKRSPSLGPEEVIHTLPDEDFLMRLEAYQGTPEQVLSCAETMKVFLPIIRADFALSETYVLPARPPLDLSTLAISGTDDPLATPDMMDAWQSLVSGKFATASLDGGHFFLSSHPRALAELIGSALLERTPVPRISPPLEKRTEPC